MAIQVLNQNEIDEVSGGNVAVVAVVAVAVVASIYIAAAYGCNISGGGGGGSYHFTVECK